MRCGKPRSVEQHVQLMLNRPNVFIRVKPAELFPVVKSTLSLLGVQIETRHEQIKVVQTK